MQIVSEIAEIVASAIDCVLVLWFLTSHFGKKKTIEWWKYAVWWEYPKVCVNLQTDVR